MPATRLLAASEAGVAEAAALLRDGRLVAFGTETVYGLGARADRGDSVAAIFAAKGRPANNPLICHYAGWDEALVDVEASPIAVRLAGLFWPGPLTLVLRRRLPGRIADDTAAGLETLAVRVPDHPLAQLLLRAVGVPVAAPSANRSGRVSPTTAAHVLEELGGRIDAVLDGGACLVGVESTVVDLTGEVPVLLRQGAVSEAAIREVVGALAPRVETVLRGPGLLASHYAPSLPVRLEADRVRAGEGLLAFGPAQATGVVFQLSEGRDLVEAASRLFAGLRALDAVQGITGIAVSPIPHEGIGAAINDRLTRAAVRA